MIPKIIHQVWVGPLEPPEKAIESWRRMNRGWDHRLHRAHTGYPAELQSVLDRIDRANRPDKWRAMTDCIRWWLLWKFGGIATDADSECIRSLDPWLLEMPEWACWENQEECPGIIANGTVGAEPGSLLMSRLVQHLPMRLPDGAPWIEFGPHYLTAEAWGYSELRVLPERHFVPWHAGLSHPYGKAAPGDHVVYARQFWGSRVGYHALDVSDPGFVVLSTGINIPEWAPMCMGSVGRQNFAVRHIVYTDSRTALTCRDVARTYERGALVDLRIDRGAALANIWEAIHELDPETVVVFCDLDDMLLPDALATVKDVYAGNPNLKITWGQFRYWPSGGTGFAHEHPDEVIRTRSFRTSKDLFYATHLRTCKAGLFQQLEAHELQHADGRWLEYAGDCAMMWSMLESTDPSIEQQFIAKQLYAYNRRFVDQLTPEQLAATKACEAEVRAKPVIVGNYFRKFKPIKVRLNVGCGKLPRPGWLNLDMTDGEGVDVVCRLGEEPIPFAANSVDEIRGDHVLEHVHNILEAMEELWNVAKPGCLARFVVPQGDLALGDPTHVRQFVRCSWDYFDQRNYTFADYGYQGDWEVQSCEVDGNQMVAILKAIKPARAILGINEVKP